MARERLEYIYPHLAPSGVTGTPAVQRTIHDENVNKIATEAVLAIDPNFSGIACVDLKEDKEGVPCVTEINAARMFTTSFFFSYASKVLRKDYYANFPYLYVRLAFKESIPEIPKYNILPENIYWIRHIDAPAKLVKDGKVIGEMYSWCE
jgi:carbamoyl-phosphate synthase large subunit